MDQARAFTELMHAHRSIRSFKTDPLPDGLINPLLESALHGSSSSGNLNMVSVVKTQDPQRKAHLCKLHGDQPMVLEAPLLLTFCADTFRTREWLAMRDARPGFADFASWHVAGYDAIILSQTVALACESHGLGICYMGTTLYAMGAIADFLELPPNCLPVTTLVVGWPAEAPAQRDRLPPAAWIHEERYQRPSTADIETRFASREARGRARYMDSNPEMAALWAEHGITSLAQYYTSKIKYDPDHSAAYGQAMEGLLRDRGFF